MAKPIQETKFLRVTDTDLDGDKTISIHSVDSGWTEPEFKHSEKYEVITEAEARKGNPALFGTTEQ